MTERKDLNKEQKPERNDLNEEQKIQKIDGFSSEERVERYSSKQDKHIHISRTKLEKIQAYARAMKIHDDDVFDIGMGFWLANKNRKMERDTALHLTTTAFEEQCDNCHKVIPACEDAYYNKNRGWVCLDCTASMGSEVLAKKKVREKRYDRAFCVLRDKVEKETLKLEGVDNEKHIHELLLTIEQNIRERHENGKNLIAFAKEFAKYSEFDAKAFLEKITNDDKQTHESLLSLLQERKVLEHTASDIIAFAKRKRRRSELSAEDADAEDVILGDAEQLMNENR